MSAMVWPILPAPITTISFIVALRAFVDVLCWLTISSNRSGHHDDSYGILRRSAVSTQHHADRPHRQTAPYPADRERPGAGGRARPPARPLAHHGAKPDRAAGTPRRHHRLHRAAL